MNMYLFMTVNHFPSILFDIQKGGANNMGQRDNFSNSDLEKLNRMYTCRNKPGNTQQNRPNRGNGRPYYGNGNYQRPSNTLGGGYGFGPYAGYYPVSGPSGPSGPNPFELGFGVLNSLAQFFG